MNAKNLIISLAILPMALTATPVYIGTGADGIYLADFDSEKGLLSIPKITAEYLRPGFLASHPLKPILYSVGADDTLAAFTINKSFGLTLIDTVPTQGISPCHLAVDAAGHTVAAANYGDGSIFTVRLNPEGTFADQTQLTNLEGSGPVSNRQTAAHTHGVYLERANRFLFAPDLGADKVFIFKFDPESSKITPATPPAFSSPAGSGPRHMDFSPDEKHAYILNELSNTITVTAYDHTSGSLKEVQEISTLPADFKDHNTTAEIEVHSNGNFVYASNRGHDSIVVYKRDQQSGKLSYLQHAPCGGKTPRHFTLDPTGKWLLCAHQESNTISVLSVDQKTGLLGNPQSTVSVPAPICLLFP